MCVPNGTDEMSCQQNFSIQLHMHTHMDGCTDSPTAECFPDCSEGDRGITTNSATTERPRCRVCLRGNIVCSS